MLYDLRELAINLADGRLSIDALRGPRTSRRLQLHAAIVVFAFNGRHRFLVGDREGSYQHSLLSLFPNSGLRQLMKWSMHDDMHKYDKYRNGHIEITPPLEFWNFVSHFGTVPLIIEEVFQKSGISSVNPQLEDIKQCGGFISEAISLTELTQAVLDDAPKRSSLVEVNGQIKISYYAVVAACLIWSCRNSLLDKEHRAPSSLSRIYRGLFGATFAAHYGNSIRGASHTIGLHSCRAKIPTFHIPEEIGAIIETHPKTLSFATRFINEAKADIEKARLKFEDMLPEVTNDQRAKHLASVIRQYEPSVVIEALHMIRNNT